ncbi:MAG: lipopolysaccharide biosynthesis protein [Phycisphaerae bacterium]|jgi:O-antigen/teichoic acid export membrane protein
MNDKPHKDLFSRTVKSGAWAFGLKLFNHLLSIVRLAILARFLTPAQFGVAGAAMLLIEVLEAFTQTGFHQSLVVRRESIDNWLNTAWTAGLIRSVILYAILFALAPLAAQIKVPEELASQTVMIIRAIGLMFILRALTNPAMVVFTKELEFDKIFKINAISNSIGALASIYIAWEYKTPWAIVCGKLIGSAGSIAGGYFVSSFRPRLELHAEKLRELWSFGKWINGSAILGFLINQGDDFLVWFYLGLKPLGLYQMSYRISTIPGDYVSDTLNKTLLPAMSKISADLPRIKAAYMKTVKLVFTLSCPVVVALVLGSEFLWVILGKKWLAAIPVVQLLCIKGFFRTIGATRGPLFMAIGKPHIGFWIRFARLIIIAATIYPLAKYYGVAGVALSVVLGAALPQPFAMHITNRVLGIKMTEYIPALLPGLILATAVTLLFMLAVAVAKAIF